MRIRPCLGVIGAGLLASSLLGCGGDKAAPTSEGGPAPGAGGKALSGEVAVDGSSTVFRISRAAQLGFKKTDASKVKVTVGNHGTGGGFGRYLQGEVDVVDASRDAKPTEESEAKQKGYDWTRFLVGYDGITVVVSKKNDFVKALTVEQLKNLYGAESKVQTWKDLDPSWPGRKISLYSPDADSGTFEFFVEAIIGAKKPQRKDVQVSPDDNTLVTGVAGDADGIGYFGYAYYASNTDKLNAVAIQNGPDAKPVLPTPETILKKTYTPLSRPLYIFVKNSSLKRPEVAAFVKYYLENGEKLATSAGYDAPTPEDKAANLKSFEAATAGEK